MAQYKRKNIEANAIGADQIALDNDKYLKAENFAKDGFVNILKVKEDNTVEIPALDAAVSLLESADAASLQSAKDYTDAQVISEQNSRIAGDDATLVSANQYTDAQVISEQNSRIAGDDATLASANLYTDNAIAAIPPVDLSAYETIVNVDSKDAATLASANLYTDNAIAAIPPVDLSAYETIVNVDSKDAATLASANLYTDNAIAAIPPVDLSEIESDIAQLKLDVDAVELVAGQAQIEVDAVELRVGTLESETDQAQSDIISLDGRVDTLEGLVIDVSTHTGNFNASPYKIHLVSGEALVKLPAPSLNKIVTIKKTGSDLVTLEPHQTEQIEGAAANYLLTSTRQSATLVSDGTDWFII